MRKVISNSTPLIALNKIEKLDLLRDIYGEIIMNQLIDSGIYIDKKLYNKVLEIAKEY